MGKWITILVAVATVVGGVWLIVQPQEWLLWALLGLSLVFGVLFVLPVGGADVPIVISLLNAMTGLAVAASGYVLGNVLLLIAGTLVGASGTLLTNLMAKAMGRPLTSTLFGAFSEQPRVERQRDRPTGAVGFGERRRHHVGLRRQGHPCPVTVSPSRRRRARCANLPTSSPRRESRSTTPSTRWLVACQGT